MISNYKVKVNDSCNYKVSITDIQNKYKFKLFCAGADLTDYYTKEQVDQSQNTQDILIDNLLNQIPTGTATGETINITDSSSLPLKDIQEAGNTYQETTTGKNILPQDKYIASQTINGITYTNNGDGTFNLNGTATANTSLRIIDTGIFNLESGQRYYFYSSVAYNSTTFNMSIVTIESGTQQYLTANSNYTPSVTPTSSRLQFYIASGNTVNVQNVKLMLVKGADDTSYEPYTNGASPNPDYPQAITNVTGTNTIKICGKNFLNYDNNTNYENKFINSSGEWQNDDETYINEKIVLNSKVISMYVGTKTGSANIRLGQYKGDGTFISRTLINSTTNNITLDNECSYIWLSINKGANVYFTNLSVVYGSSNTEYEAYKEKSYTINLGSIELCKIRDYKDRIYYSSGKWYLEKNIGKVTLNGSESWNSWYNVGNNIGFYYNNNSLAVIGVETALNGALYCNKFSETPLRTDIVYGDVEAIKQCGGTGNQYIALGVNKTRLSDYSTKALAISSLKSWLSSNNVYYYYVLATPTTAEITDTTLKGQLDALINSTTYKTTTNIMVDTTNQKPTLTLTYRKDLETLIGG